MYCSKCGEKLEENATVCPKCGAPVAAKCECKAKTLKPVCLITLILSSMAFLFGFILITCALAKGFLINADFLATLPALVCFCVGLYQFLDSKSDKTTKLLSIVSFSLSAFTLFYTFLSYIIMIAG